ncbi:phage tail tape measure protein [Pluralibacter gergoviae]|nr:phage tail tape measure protein [Pluralibacter gergoviae]
MDLSIRVAFSAIDKLTRPVSAASKSIGGLSDSLKKTQSSIKDLEKGAASFEKLRNQANDTAQKLRNTQRSLDGLNQKQREGGQLTDAQTARLETLRNKLSRLTDTYSKQTVQLRAATQAVRQHGVNISSGSGTIQAAIRRTEQYNQTLERERRQLAATTRAQAGYERAKETGSKLRGAGMGMVIGSGAGIFAPIAATVKQYSTLEDAMKGVAKQVNGLRDNNGQRTAQFYEMQKAITAASEKLPLPGGAADYAALVEGGARMGVANGDDPWEKQKKDLLSFATTAAMAAKAFELPADQLSEDLGKIAGLYSVPTAKIEALGDAINYLDDNAKSKGSDIIEVLKRIGGVADKLDYRKAAALGSTFLTLGTAPEVAASASNAMVRELSIATTQSKTFMAGLDALGMSAERLQKNMSIDAMGTIVSVLEAVKKLPSANRTSVLTQIFGKEFGDDAAKLANNLPELYRQLKLVNSEASKGSMRRESDIDLDSLSSQWLLLKASASNTMSSIGETLREPMLDLFSTVSGSLKSLHQWIKDNKELVGSTLKVAAAVGAVIAVIGWLAIAIGSILVPMALLRLSFTLLAGERGIAGTITAFRTLGTRAGPVMANMRSWSVLLSGLASGFGRVSTLLPAVRAGLLATFVSPGVALKSLARGIAMLLLRLTGLPAIWGMITTAVSVLGGALSFLLSPIGLIGAAFVAAGILIWRYWEPIKSFFTGFFAGVWQALTPFREALSGLVPVFSAIGDGIKSVWNWFKNLLTPMETSKETLEKCASAGETFGRVMGTALSVLLWPLQQLMNGVGWLLEKLDLIPDGIERAQQKASEARKALEDSAAALSNHQLPLGQATVSGATGGHKPPALTGETGTGRRLQSIANNTKATADNTKKRVGPGDIIFKNLPRALALRGAYQEARISPRAVPRVGAPAAGGIISVPAATAAPVMAPVSAPAGGAPVFNLVFNDVGKRTDQELEKMVRTAVREALASTGRSNRGSFRDRE